MHKKASNFGARINIHSSFFLYHTQLGESSENSSVYSKPGTFQSIGLKVQATELDQTDVNPVKNNETQQRKGTQDRSMDRFEWKISTRCL
jgi:hypothetical protein